MQAYLENFLSNLNLKKNLSEFDCRIESCEFSNDE